MAESVSAAKILVVDDSEENVRFFTLLLQDRLEDATVFPALDGAEALRLVKSQKPDLVLLDAVMPGISGFDVCKAIKEDVDTMRIPVLMISGILVNAEHRVSGLQAGAEGYLSKPFEHDELIAQVMMLLRMKRYEDALIRHETRLADMLEERSRDLRQREEYLRCLFEGCPDAILVQDRQGKILDVNKASCGLYGRSREALIGLNALDLVPEDARDEFINNLSGWDAERINTFEGWACSNAESATPIEIRGSSVRYHGQNAILFHVRDISRRRTVENELQEHRTELQAQVKQRTEALEIANKELQRSQASFHSLVEQSNEGVLVLDDKHKILYANPAAGQFLGIPGDKIVGSVFEHDVSPGVPKQISLQGPNMTVEAFMSATQWHGARASLVTLRDVSLRLLAEQQMARSEHLQSLGVLAGGIAHDFNNLLTGIAGNLSLAELETGSSHACQRSITEALQAATRAKTLTQQLLTFAKGGHPLRETASVSRILRETSRFALAGSTSACDLKIQKGLWNAYIDSAQISQVIENLIINAAQSMPDGGHIEVIADNVTLGSEAAELGLSLDPGRFVRIAVKDEGEGIPPEKISKIFDPYFTTKADGSGLGLAICFSVLTRHGGDISVKSRSGKGTVFTLYIPASSEQVRAASEKAPVQGRGEGKRVLVMDDEEIIRSLASRILSSLGYEVECVEDGNAALESYRQALSAGNAFDAVILDLTIPGGLGGEATLKALKEIDPNVRALVSSGYSDSAIVAGYKQTGFAGVIPKPYDVKALGDAVLEVTAEA